MSEEKSGPVELGAEMDYPEHEKTYALFLAITKWSVVITIALLIAMAFGFFTTAGFFSSTVLLILLCVGAYYILK